VIPAVEVGEARVFLGDCREILRGLADNSVDSVVTDPPYELGFMGKKWDSTGIAYDVSVWEECLRVLKPGGHILAFGGTRTWHRLAVAIEDAGFEIRDSIAWMYGSGFPKSLDVSKAIDKGMGKNRERQLEFTAWMRASGLSQKDCAGLVRDFAKNDETASAMAQHYYSDKTQPAIATADIFDAMRAGLPPVPENIERLVAERTGIEWTEYKNRQIIAKGYRVDAKTSAVPVSGATPDGHYDITAAHTSEAKQWEGWGTALKPTHEPIVVGRKPFAKGSTVAANVLLHGVGALNIDGSRIGYASNADKGKALAGDAFKRKDTSDKGWSRPWMEDAEKIKQMNIDSKERAQAGRWPANVILDEYSAGLLDEQSGHTRDGVAMKGNSAGNNIFSENSKPTAPNHGYGGQGGASRFFYCAKASKRDRNEGLDGLEPRNAYKKGGVGGTGGKRNVSEAENATPKQNFHPTVKPTTLMRYLIKLVTPPGGTVLDPFTGSGSTGKAALLDGFGFVGVELTEEYLPIIEGRLRWALEQVGETDERLF